MEHQCLGEVEMKQLIYALGHGGNHFSEEDVFKVFEWATMIRMGHAMLELALKGTLALRVDDDGGVCGQLRKKKG